MFNMEYKKAILRPFQDWNKFLLGVLLSIFPILNIFVKGYGLECAKSTMNKKNKLPEWTLDNFVKGLMNMVISIIYMLPIAVVLLIFGGMTGMQAIIFQDFTDFMVGNMLVGIILGVLLALVILYILPMVMMSYVEKWKFKDAFDIKKIIRKSFNLKYLEVFLIFVGYIILISFVTLIFVMIPYVGNFISMGLVGFILTVTGNTLFGEVYKKVK
ncbi:hypothetical protein CL618_01450 [archaeon]|nr:hypothetical protein [archaeon]|tara:strand:+ start:1022 stop:1663 length:642 start_codon:yes stop_codon:yes gene_type:complete